MMEEKHYDAIVFDMDHTLFDRYNTLRSIAYILKARHAEWFAPELSAAQIGDLLAKGDQNYIYQGWRVIFANLIEWGMFADTPSFEDYFAACMEAFCEVVVPIPLVHEMLLDFRKEGYKLGLITNGKPITQRPKIKMLHFEEVMDEILIGGEYGIPKPKPDIFIEMSRRLGCDPNRMLYVGDHPRNDVEGSRRAGYTPIWVKATGKPWTFTEYEPAPYEVNDVLELPNLLRKINEG